jgi:hypothetical protein
MPKPQPKVNERIILVDNLGSLLTTVDEEKTKREISKLNVFKRFLCFISKRYRYKFTVLKGFKVTKRE